MANNWAVVIGINDYQHHPERRLKYAINDAQKIGNFLSRQAGFGSEHIILCLGDETHRGNSTYPTCSNLLRVLKRDLQPNRLDKIDRLWFYFSGHGVSCNGRDYLITSDCFEDEIERFALPIDEVIAILRSHQDADIVLILDACRHLLGVKSFDRPIGKQTVASAKEYGITTIFSCDYGQYSYELEALQQGVFTYALLEGLSQHTLPHQLENHLQERVQALHLQYRRNGANQTPRIRIEPTSKALQPLLPGAVNVVASRDNYTSSRSNDNLSSKNSYTSSRSNDNLSSEKGINYTRLRDLLIARDWKAADYETYSIMLKVVGRKRSFSIFDIAEFPCNDLRTIDRLWVEYSRGQFGFSIQKKIYLNCGGSRNQPVNEFPSDRVWRQYCNCVGWRVNNNWIKNTDVIFDISAPQGHLPCIWRVNGLAWSLSEVRDNESFFFRTTACQL